MIRPIRKLNESSIGRIIKGYKLDKDSGIYNSKSDSKMTKSERDAWETYGHIPKLYDVHSIINANKRFAAYDSETDSIVQIDIDGKITKQ